MRNPEANGHDSLRSVAFDLTPNADGFTLEGYAAVFNEPTRISNKWEGDFTETIVPGAFARAVRANPKPVMQFDHGQDSAIGGNAIGFVQSMREDAKGLFVSAGLHDNWQSLPVRDAIKSGAIRGMSFRFTVPQGGDTWSDDFEERTISDVDVHELGPVTWPAYAGTEVSVRSREFATAIADDQQSDNPSLLKDLSIGLLLANHRDEIPDPTTEEEDPARIDAFVVEPAEPDPEVVRVVNPAKRLTTVMAIRTDLATQRSQNATHQLSDR